MTAPLLHVGDVAMLRGESWKVISISPTGTLFKSAVSRSPRFLTGEQVDALRHRGEMVLSAAREESLERARAQLLNTHLRDLPPEIRLRTHRAFAYVRLLDALPHGHRSLELAPSLSALAKTLNDPSPPSVRQVYALWSRWCRANRDPLALVPLIGRRGNRTSRLNPVVSAIISDMVDEIYLTEEKPTIASCVRAVGCEIQRYSDRTGIHLEMPSSKAIYRHVAARDGFQKTAGREGRRAAQIKFANRAPGPSTSRINEVWEVDHTMADVHLYDEQRGLLMGRPWITAIVDRYSRMIVGFFIGFEPPSYVSVMHALRHAIAPKTYLRDLYPSVRFDYPCCGLPELLVTDNGAEFGADAFRDAMVELTVDYQACPVRQPWYKGVIERWFLTLRLQLLQQMPGNSAGENRQNGEYQPDQKACMGFARFVEVFHLWLIDDYHQALHAGIASTPAERWMQSFRREGHQVSRPPPDAAKLECLTGVAALAKPQHYGVKFKGLIYQSPRLASIRSRYQDRVRIKLKVDPLNLGRVQAYCPIGREWFPLVPAIPEYVEGLTLHQHKVASQILRQEQNDQETITREARLRSRSRLAALVSEASVKKGQARRRTLRMINLAPEGMGAKVLALSDHLQERDTTIPSMDEEPPNLRSHGDLESVMLPEQEDDIPVPRTGLHKIIDPTRSAR